jgi:hypothetical protein
MAGEGRVLAGVVRLERCIGRGGMGEVWQATHARLGARVAVKLLHGSGEGPPTPEAWARFDREARTIAELRSPHVVQVLDRGVTETGEPFLVMELLEGRDLAHHLELHGRLSVAETLELVEQISRGLARAHELGVVHRDIKPGNVFLVPTSGGVHVKLLDFGLAKVEAWGGAHKTASGMVLGTPFYMSPEQLFEPSRVDHRADLWALSVLAYACLTGRVPFRGDTFGALSVAVHAGRFDPPSRLRPELPSGLDAFMARALAPRLEQRFSSVGELMAALRAAASLPHAVVGAPPFATPAGPPAARVPGASALAEAPTEQVRAPAPPAVPPALSPARVASVASRSSGLSTPKRVALSGAALALVLGAWGVVALVRAPGSKPSAHDDGDEGLSAGATAVPRGEPQGAAVPGLPTGAPSLVAKGRELSTSSLATLYAHAFAEARKVDDSARVASLSLKGLDPQGRLADEGLFRATFSTSTWSCVVVSISSTRTEVGGGKCGRAPALRYPPRCSLKALRARIASAEEHVSVLYTVSLGQPSWIVEKGGAPTIADDC